MEVSDMPLTQENYVCRYGHFSGINRKVQLTYLRNGQPKTSSEEEGMMTAMCLNILS